MEIQQVEHASWFRTKCCKITAIVVSSWNNHATTFMVIFGVAVLAFGLHQVALTQPGLGVEEGDERIEIVTTRIFKLIEGNAGSLVMVIAGLGAIISAAFGAYRAAVGLLVVAVGAFILRSLVDIFFNFNENDA